MLALYDSAVPIFSKCNKTHEPKKMTTEDILILFSSCNQGTIIQPLGTGVPCDDIGAMAAQKEHCNVLALFSSFC